VQDSYLDVPFVTSVFHPSDFSATSENAFAHALAIALHRQTEFTILHAAGRKPSREDWTRFPAVRSTLERWGFLEKGSRRSAVFEELRVNVKKILARSDNPVTAALDFLKSNPTDLIVLSTEGRDGLSQWIQPSVAERLAQRSKTKTLFVPADARGFVSPESGEVTLRKILVPVDRKPDPTPAIVYSTRTARLLEGGGIEVILLHVGDESGFPEVRTPEATNCSFARLCRPGSPVDEIVKVAAEESVDLIMMTTEGWNGILDVLRGTVTEKVLRHAPCPLLAVPA
jgi:nucleotide-binding universal stress UspA family protein